VPNGSPRRTAPEQTLELKDGRYGRGLVACRSGQHPKLAGRGRRTDCGQPPRGRRGHPSAGRAPAPAHYPGGRGAVAVVGGPPAPGPVLAALHPPLRFEALVPLMQAGAGLDHPQGAHARAGRPLDLAGAAGLHPAAPGPAHRHRGAASLGTTPAGAPADCRPDPPRIPPTTADPGHPGEPAETLRTIPETTSRQPTRPAARQPAIKTTVA